MLRFESLENPVCGLEKIDETAFAWVGDYEDVLTNADPTTAQST